MRVLVVEDDTEIRNLLAASLKSEGFFVDTAGTGTEGCLLATTNPYDIIILDYMLPGKDGIEVCTQLRTEGITTHIIGLSAKSETKNKVRFLDAGADDYVTKPFSFEELLARMRALKRRPQTIESDIYVAGDLELNVTEHTVKKDNLRIYLTRKEFALLEYLMKNKGVALTRNMILEQVWDINANPFSNTVETHVMTLRKKVDTEDGIKLILTLPGIGYKIE